jgi:methylmalonyl-CoA mutase N-terminal domain/subunit
MQMLVEEMGLADTVDPLAGSYYIEWLTNEFERRIMEEMTRIDAQGGMVKLVADGTVQREVSKQAYILEKKLQTGEMVKVGMNKYRQEVSEEEKAVEFHEYDPAVAREKIEGLRKVKAERDNTAVKAALERLKAAARGKENLMPYIMDAVKTYATVGEMTNVMKEVFGTFKEPVNL